MDLLGQRSGVNVVLCTSSIEYYIVFWYLVGPCEDLLVVGACMYVMSFDDFDVMLVW